MFASLFKFSSVYSAAYKLYQSLTLASVAMNSTSTAIGSGGLSLHERLSNYKPTELRADLSHLTLGDKRALVKLADVSDLLNSAYYQQIWSGAPRLRQQLTEDAQRHANSTKDPAPAERLALFELFRGPWDRSFENEPFIESVGSKPKSANVYPEDMTVTEFDKWVATLSSEEERKHARGFYHIIKRHQVDRELTIVSYADEYREHLVPATRLLREAAELVSDPSFAQFLRMRGDAFESNQYLESEVAWLNISHESALEAAIGPYETYEDELFSAKAFFEAMVHVRDFEASRVLDKFTASLELVERHLPIPDEYRNRDLVPPPIVVVNQVYSGGDTAVPMTAAYNLPNDEEAIERGGSKLTLIKNVQQGKVRSVLLPIAETVLRKSDLEYVTFDAFFTHVLLHEVAHSNGPHRVLNSRDTVRSRLQDLHSAFEEAKADIAGLFAAQLLIDHGIIDDISARQFYTTYLASAFRSVRFGLAEAHGLGQAMQLSYLLERGAFVYDNVEEKFAVDMDRIPSAVADLTRDIMLIQGDGVKQRAVEFRERYGALAPSVKRALEKLKRVPIDIAPIWADINELRQMELE
ncbi:hypothetical protein GGI20_000507 [Coemansia sp. BCRC 34301]|nr:hypothetical protein GGI20_000507 [Coemansia sp. BCRC 34301]